VSDPELNLISNSHVPFWQLKSGFKPDDEVPDEDQNENEGEERGVEETYSDYMPAKCKP